MGILVISAVLVSCAAVRSRRGTPEQSGFLGDYSQLTQREGADAQLSYVAEGVDWRAYNAVEIDSVTIWVNEETAKFSDEERQMMTELIYTALHQELGAQFEVVDHAGPGVMRLRAALTQAEGSSVVLRSVTSILPPAFILSTVGGLSTDTAATVGTATVEVEVSDAISGKRLAAAVDSRAGTKSILAGSRTFTKWGDVEAAAQFWAQRVTAFLVRQGVERQPGAPEIE
jgi:hypothetical protein